MGEIQKEIDAFLRSSSLRSVRDIIYVPEDRVAVVIRNTGHRNVIIDLSSASKSDVVKIIGAYKAVY